MFFLGRLFVHNRGLVVVAVGFSLTPADTMIVIRLFTEHIAIHGDLAAIIHTLSTPGS